MRLAGNTFGKLHPLKRQRRAEGLCARPALRKMRRVYDDCLDDPLAQSRGLARFHPLRPVRQRRATGTAGLRDAALCPSRNRIQYPRPRADAFVKALHVVFFVGRMDLVVVLAKADEHGGGAKDILEMPRDRD